MFNIFLKNDAVDKPTTLLNIHMLSFFVTPILPLFGILQYFIILDIFI